MKIQNMKSANGNDVPNQFEIIDDSGNRYFQSYKTVIAFIEKETGTIALDRKAWDYSKTTSKYRNMFLGLTTNQTQAKIKSGEIVLADLNQ